MTIKEIPITGYANLYSFTEKHLFATDNSAEIREEKKFALGQLYTNKNDVPNHYELDNAKHKHVGIVKVSINMED